MNRALVIVLALAASAAQAESATVKLFEAPAYERPDKSSPVLHTFVENAQVSVSETSEQGFRKIRLPDGKVGFIEEAALSLGGAAAASANATAATAIPSDAPVQAKPSPRASVFVKDLKHLAELVKVDATVAPMAQRLATKESTAAIVSLSSLLAGTAAVVVGMLVVPKTQCGFDTVGGQSCTYGAANWGVAGAGLGVGLIGGLAGLALLPTRAELLDVLNAWNQRHPEEPFEISGPQAR